MCIRDTSGDTWTVVLKRDSGVEKFDRTFLEYENGFGDPKDEYWIGIL